MRSRWNEFQAMVDRCDTVTSSDAEGCLAKARDTYRAANFKCDALGAQQRTECLQFAEHWNITVSDAPASVSDAPASTVKRAEEPAVTATDPGDPLPAERNRDSTKQH